MSVQPIPSLLKTAQLASAQQATKELHELNAQVAALSLADHTEAEVDVDDFPNLHSLALLPDPLIPGVISKINLQNLSAVELDVILSFLPDAETTSLNLKRCDISLINFSTLPSSLRVLRVSSITQKQLDDLAAKCPNLQLLEVVGAHEVSDFRSLEKLDDLKALHIFHGSSMQHLPRYMPNLRILDLVNCKQIESLPHLSNFPELRLLKASFCAELKRFPILPPDHPIKKIELRHCYKLKELPPIRAKDLIELKCVGVGARQALYFGDCPNLKHVELSFCKQILNLVGLHPRERTPKLFSVTSEGMVKHPGVVRALMNLPRHIFLKM